MLCYCVWLCWCAPTLSLTLVRRAIPPPPVGVTAVGLTAMEQRAMWAPHPDISESSLIPQPSPCRATHSQWLSEEGHKNPEACIHERQTQWHILEDQDEARLLLKALLCFISSPCLFSFLHSGKDFPREQNSVNLLHSTPILRFCIW